MVVLNKEDYIKKAKHLLNQPTYKKMTEDPTSKQKARLIKLLKNIKAEGASLKRNTRRCTPQELGLQNSMGSLKFTSKIHH